MDKYISEIEDKGFCRIPQVLSPKQVQETLDLILEWHRRTQDAITKVPNMARGNFVWNLQNKDFYFLDLLFSAEIVHEILKHFLNDQWFRPIPPDGPNYILRSYMARSSDKALPMHIDSLVPYIGSETFVMQTAFVLEDQNVANGCTYVVPGSHQSGKFAYQSGFDEAIPIESKAGDVVIWDSRIWHGTRANTSGRTRWALIPTFTRWWIKQQFNIPQNLPQEFYERLTDWQKAVLGYCSLPYNNESEGVDMKRGYDSLLPRVMEYRVFPEG